MRFLANENFPGAAVLHDDWTGHFFVIELGRIRKRSLS